jgi:hypothetical protein
MEQEEEAEPKARIVMYLSQNPTRTMCRILHYNLVLEFKHIFIVLFIIS